MAGGTSLSRQLNTFDVTNLVVGSIIGADIYVAAALGAKLVGPFSILIWLAAGIIATVIALSFSYCVTILPREGGPYSYTRAVAGPFSGFIVGWSLFLAEWFSLAVFPVAFTRYFLFLIPELQNNLVAEILLKGAFIAVVLLTNLVGIKSAGRFNDALTLGKLSPLILLVVAGLIAVVLRPQETISNFQPLVRGSIGSSGQALVLIFWAYAGFELATLPPEEIRQPERTIPKAIAIGMTIVMLFYLTTNFVLIGTVNQDALAASTTPLTTMSSQIFSFSSTVALAATIFVGVGALISIMGADESGTIGTSRLAFAMSIDGLFPKTFSKLHRTFHTPYIGLILICGTAFIASILGTLTELINASVFLLALVYLTTCISAALLKKKYPDRSKNLKGTRIITVLGAALSLLLMSQVNVGQILVSLILIVIGIPIYILFSPKAEIREMKQVFLSDEAVLKRAYRQRELFLAHFLNHIRLLARSLTRRTKHHPTGKSNNR